MKEEWKGIKFVVSADIGTSGTAFAFARVSRDGSPLNIYCEPWDHSTQTPKTRTALLFRDDQRDEDGNVPVVFGTKALKEYMELLERKKEDEGEEDFEVENRIFSSFKKRIYVYDEKLARAYSDEVLSLDDWNVDSDNRFRNKTSLITLFEETMKAIKSKALQSIRKQSDDAQEHEILWILTVPAIWTSVSKGFMDMAARLAGFTHWEICLEPVAAALAVMHQQDINVASSFLVVDSGAGSIDFTVFEIEEENTIKSVSAPEGAWIGSSRINERFREFLDIIFDDIEGQHQLFVDRMKTRLFEDFETKKILLTSTETNLDQVVSFDLLKSFKRGPARTTIERRLNGYFEEEVDFIQGFNQRNDLNFEIDWEDATPRLRIKYGDFLKYFTKHVINDAVEKIINVLDNNRDKNITRVFFVGGFSSCAPFQRKVQKLVERRYLSFVTPSNGSTLFVAQGAVYFGLGLLNVPEVPTLNLPVPQPIDFELLSGVSSSSSSSSSAPLLPPTFDATFDDE